MSQLLQISIFRIIAVPDNVKITPEMRRDALDKNTIQLGNELTIDWRNTMLLDEMLMQQNFGDGIFENQAEIQNPAITTDEKYTYVYPQYYVDSNDIPDVMKAAGLKILRKNRIVYFMDDPDHPRKYKLMDAKGEKFALIRTDPLGTAADWTIEIIDTISAIPTGAFEDISRQAQNTGLPRNLTEEKFSYGAVMMEMLRDDKENGGYVLEHELKHIKNARLNEDELLHNRDIALSATNLYRLEIDDEISAKMAEVLKAIEIFQRRGKTENFEGKDFEMLSNVPYEIGHYILDNLDQNIFAATLDIKKIVKLVFDTWFRIYMDAYKENCKIRTLATLNSISQISQTPNDAAYRRLRSLYYNFSVYNPATGNYINMDLSEFVPEIELSPQDENMLMSKQKEILSERRQRFYEWTDGLSGKFDLSLVPRAIEMQCAMVEQTAYGRRMAELTKMGLSAGAALDWKPGMNIVSKDMEILGMPAQKDMKGINVREILHRATAKVKKKNVDITTLTIAKNTHNENDTH